MERLEIIGTVIASVLTACGGWEAIKYLLNKETNKRIAEAEADSVEFTLLRDTNNFLQEQLQNKEHRFAEQTELVRKLFQSTLPTWGATLTRQAGGYQD